MLKHKHPRASPKVVRENFFYDREKGLLWWRKRGCRRQMDRPAGYASNGYVRVHFFGNSYSVHVLAWVIVKGRWPKKEIDHCDTNKSNNRWRNLRLATHGQNQRNGHRYKNNKSGLKRVTLHRDGKRYRADIQANGVQRYLGIFDTKEQASAAYIIAAKKLHKEFARF